MKMKIFRKMIPAFGSRLRRLSVVLSILLLPPAGAAEEPAARGTPRENGNAFLLVNSPDGRGGAFFATIWKQPVILTSARTGSNSPLRRYAMQTGGVSGFGRCWSRGSAIW